ncbi:MAG: ABC transporter permease [Cyanobacteria bacterium P01_C01_bin.69]
MSMRYHKVYRADSALKHPVQLCRQMLQDLVASRELAWRLMIRDIKAQYRQSFLGLLWAFVPPVVTAVGITYARSVGVVSLGETELPYPAYVMFSMALWQTFVESLSGPISAVSSAKTMLARINFPREALILSKLGELFFNFGIKLLLIIGLFVGFQMPVTWAALLAPVALVHLVLLGTGIGLLLAPLGVLYQDVSRLLTVIVVPWLLITPVIYPLPQGTGVFHSIVKWNPVTPLLVTTRELATTGVLTKPSSFWLASLVAWLFLFFGWLLYRLSMPFIVERMSA